MASAAPSFEEEIWQKVNAEVWVQALYYIQDEHLSINWSKVFHPLIMDSLHYQKSMYYEQHHDCSIF